MVNYEQASSAASDAWGTCKGEAAADLVVLHSLRWRGKRIEETNEPPECQH
jgi:hypothetical protein